MPQRLRARNSSNGRTTSASWACSTLTVFLAPRAALIETLITYLVYVGDDTTQLHGDFRCHHKDPQGTKRIGLRGGFLQTRSLHLFGLLFQICHENTLRSSCFSPRSMCWPTSTASLNTQRLLRTTVKQGEAISHHLEALCNFRFWFRKTVQSTLFNNRAPVHIW